MRKKSQSPKPSKPRPGRLSPARLERLIDEATVDAYDDSEQVVGLYSMIEDHLKLPIATEILGVPVVVESIELTDDESIVAVCRAANKRQRIRIVDVPLPDPPPSGSEWIEAYRKWASRR